MRNWTLLIMLVWAVATQSPAIAANPVADTSGYNKQIAPFLKQHCYDCHGSDSPEAELSLTKIDSDILQGKDLKTWKHVAEKLALGDMPPEGEPRPDAAKVAVVVGWIKTELEKAGEDTSDIGRKMMFPGHGNRVDHRALFSGKHQGPAYSPARLWRFSPQIYDSYIPKINKDVRVGQAFSTSSGEGFKDYSDLFVVDEPTISQLMRNAQAIVKRQCGDRPLKEFDALLKAGEAATEEQKSTAITKQFQLALFRPPTEEERSRFLTLMDRNIQDAGREVGIETTLATVLLLPEAIYRIEMGNGKPDQHGRYFLSPREIAYSLSYALSDDPPEGALLNAANNGKLNSKEDVKRELERILADNKISKPRLMRFFEEYFGFPHAEDVFKDLRAGQWRPEVLIHDTRQLIEYILEKDQEVLKELLTSNKSFVNYKVDRKEGPVQARALKAKQPKKDKKTGKLIPVPPRDPNREVAIHDHYSLPLDWKWEKNQPIEFPQEERSGILTQPSWLAAFATNNENQAIQRGKWIRERLLGGIVPDLPISVDAKLPDAPHQTLRQRMEITKENYCWQCHQKMNPLGLMFEHYDFIGKYRKAEPVLDPEATKKNVDKKGKPAGDVIKEIPVDASGVVKTYGDPSLEGEYQNINQLLKKLAESDHVRQVFVRHAFRYWMGRNETLDDSPTLMAAEEAYVKSGGSMKALIVSLLTSDSFLYRKKID